MTSVCFIIVITCSDLLNENDLKIFFSGLWSIVGELTSVPVKHYLLGLLMIKKKSLNFVSFWIPAICNNTYVVYVIPVSMLGHWIVK